MALRVVGAGLGRTGTTSLKVALERLLGGPCYHMVEVFGHPDHVAVWQAAVDGKEPDWEAFLVGYRASIDWPAAAFWPELSAAYPEAVVLLSTRADADAWWRSVDRTVFEAMRRPPLPGMEAWRTMTEGLFARFAHSWDDAAAAKAAYEAHNQTVRDTVPEHRLVEWQPGDGWEPLCGALGLAVPDEPFPHLNTTAEFRTMTGWDA